MVVRIEHTAPRDRGPGVIFEDSPCELIFTLSLQPECSLQRAEQIQQVAAAEMQFLLLRYPEIISGTADLADRRLILARD